MNQYILNDVDGILIAITFVILILISFWFGHKVGRDTERYSQLKEKTQ